MKRRRKREKFVSKMKNDDHNNYDPLRCVDLGINAKYLMKKKNFLNYVLLNTFRNFS
jgi:hypothetical protein